MSVTTTVPSKPVIPGGLTAAAVRGHLVALNP
jgi:hypothetical protein